MGIMVGIYLPVYMPSYPWWPYYSSWYIPYLHTPGTPSIPLYYRLSVLPCPLTLRCPVTMPWLTLGDSPG